MKSLRNIAILVQLMTSLCAAADLRFTWLPFSSNVPGLSATSTPTTQYGISVLMDSDNPKVTEFQVTVIVKRANGVISTIPNTVARTPKANNVQYSTISSALVDDSPNFEVLAVQVKAISGVNVTRPTPGLAYSTDAQ